MKKRIFPVFLALVLCLGLAVPAFAAEPDFVVENGVLTKYNGPGGGVVIPSGVTEIGQKAFRNCTSMTSITIHDRVTEIGVSAFAGCTGLTSVTIPNSITVIRGDGITGNGAFSWCTGLTNITIPNSVTKIESCAFLGCRGLTNVTIPNSVTEIGALAFQFTNLTSVTIPSSVMEIGAGAFQGCIICGYQDSAAERYAKENNLPFVPLGVSSTPFFTDVPSWCADAVSWAAANGIAQGTGNGKFSPGNDCTRAQILTFLWRAKGEPDSSATQFSGVRDYGSALAWAYENGLIDRREIYSGRCSRAAAVWFIWVAQGMPAATKISSFTDVDYSTPNAEAINWAVENGIVEGYPDGTFRPDTVCNRGAIAAMLHRAYVPEARLNVES